eukprot:CAMPEP_0119028514 /NCGR_PEP_ID=MMETSP1176-20130426/39034_1 /TAXON_ID=265551 /ORGANISM="Synedropsis recta cf, Strain CCMP1620" /LENGTH=106 /DNA_ID=CAMNT_0006984661 /DNA_START=1 /DNA_END=318 /DNA_ORIENTATION=-
MLDILAYGREMTGWCQLILPTPPEPTQQPADANPEVTVLLDGSEALDVHSDPPSGGSDANVKTNTLDSGRHYFVPPEVPGASSKLLLPILQPCFRVTMATFGTISP